MKCRIQIYKNIGNYRLGQRARVFKLKLETIDVRFAELPASALSLTSFKLHHIDQHLIGYQSVSIGHFSEKIGSIKLADRKCFVSCHAKRCHRKNISNIFKARHTFVHQYLTIISAKFRKNPTNLHTCTLLIHLKRGQYSQKNKPRVFGPKRFYQFSHLVNAGVNVAHAADQ